MKKSPGLLFAVLSAVFIGTSIVIGSVVSKHVNPIVLTFLLYLIAIPFMFIVGVSQKLQIKRLFLEFSKDLTHIFIFRTIIGQLLILYGLSMTIAIRAGFITRLEPVFVFIFSVLVIKEKIKSRKVGLLLILIFGAFLFTTSGNINALEEIMPGDMILILALAFLAYTYMPSARVMKKINPSTLLLSLYILAVVILMPVILIFFQSYLAISTNDFILILAYSLTFHVFGIMLWFIALKSVKPWIVASMLSLTPIVSSLLAFFWLGQTLLTIQLIGGAIIIITTFFIGRENRKA